MGTPTLSVLRRRPQHEARPAFEDRAEFIEAPCGRNRAARGVLTGVVVGASLWGVILVLAGVIKL